MKDYEPRASAKVIAELSSRNRAFGEGLAARRIEELWKNLLGEPARRYTVRTTFRRGVLSVEVANDAWKNELSLRRSELAGHINAQLGLTAVTDIRLL